MQSNQEGRNAVSKRCKQAVLSKEECSGDPSAKRERDVEEHDEVTKHDDLDVGIRALRAGISAHPFRPSRDAPC